MSIISKTAANEVAIKLTAGKQKDLNEKENSFREFCTVLAESKIPKFIAEAHKRSPEFFNNYQNVYFSGQGITYKGSKRLNRCIPASGSNVQLSPEEAKEYISKLNALDQQEAELEKVRLDIEAALYGLKTYKKIAEFFPEAVPFLPAKTETSLVIDILKLRKSIK